MKTDHLKVHKEDVFALAPIRWKEDSVTYASDKPFVTPYGTVWFYVVSNVVALYTRIHDLEGAIYVPSLVVSSDIPSEYSDSSGLMDEKSDEYFFDNRDIAYRFPLETRMAASLEDYKFGPLNYNYYVWYWPLHLRDRYYKRTEEGLVCLLEARLGFGLPSYNSDTIPVVRLKLFEPVPLRVLCGIDSEKDAPNDDDYSSS